MTYYTEAQRNFQERFATRALADTLEASIVQTSLNDEHTSFITTRDFFYLSTVSVEGEPTVSHKGGGVGAVKVIDERTLLFPAYDGNGMFLSLGNIADTGKIGLLFMDFETPHRLRVQADAEVSFSPEHLNLFPGSIAVVHAQVQRVFLNCARYIHKYKRLEPSKHVPNEQGDQPLASWKRIDFVQEVLPQEDQAQAKTDGLISAEDYAALLKQGDS